MKHQAVTSLNWDTATDFRAKATYGVAFTALLVLLPVAVLDLLQSKIAIGLGSICIVLFLVTNAAIVYTGRCHQKLTLFGLVPAAMVFMLEVFANDGLIGSFWCYPSIVACYCMLSANRAAIANITILAFSLPMVFTTLQPEHAYRVCATLLAISLFSAILVSVIDKQQQRMRQLLIHDPLTGLLNRFTLKENLTSAIEQYKSSNTKSTILAIDIDHFKSINDQYGHDIGDQALVHIGQLFRANLRNTDAAYRIGGEEFLMLLNDVSEKQARITARRLRHLTELATIVPGLQLTISIGLATCESADDWTQWMKMADESLYLAKNQGRNRIVESTQNHAGFTAARMINI